MLAVALMQTWLCACGGGGGGGDTGQASLGNTLPPTSGPGDAETLFPTSTGDVWYYDSTDTPSSATASHHFETVAVSGQKTVMGQAAAIFLDTSSEAAGTDIESYYYKNPGGLAYLGDSDATDTLSAALVPYIELLFPVAAGKVAQFSKSDVNFGQDLDGDSINETANLNLSVTVDGFESLDTQLGSFARTAHSTESLTGNLTLSSNHTSVPFSSSQDIWAAPGIGIIKRVLVTTVQNQTDQEVLEARGYVVDGVGHGLSVPFTVQSNLSPPDVDIDTRPALACGPSNCLSVSKTPDGVLGSLFDSMGTALASVNLGAAGSTAAVFDGTNYMVIVSGDGVPLRVHRVTTAGVSLDGTAGITVAGAVPTPSGVGPAAASGSSSTLIVYSTYDSQLSQHLLFGTLIDRNGMAVAPGVFPIATDNSTHTYPAVAFDGTNYLVVWQQNPQSGMDPTTADIYGVRVGQAGAVVDAAPIAISTAVNGQYSPGVAFDGTHYLVAWLDGRNLPASASPTQGCTSSCEIHGARVTPAGVLLDGPAATGGIGIGTKSGQLPGGFPGVGFDGSQFLVAWTTLGYASTGAPGIQLARVTSSGTVSTPVGGLALSGAPTASMTSQYGVPVIASKTSGACIAWRDIGPPQNVLAVTSFGAN